MRTCGEFDRLQVGIGLEGESGDRWRQHLAGCAECAEQAKTDALLRAALDAPVPQLSPGFEAALRRDLAGRAATRPVAARPPARLRPSGLWALAGYGTIAAAASAVILARLPWEALTPSPVFGIALGAVALLSPLALLDRVGIFRPPG